MNINKTEGPKYQEFEPNTAFYDPPVNTYKINEKGSTQYGISQTVDILIQELNEKGPLGVISSLIGPDSYKDPAKQKHSIRGHQTWGWDKFSARSEGLTPRKVLVIGAKKEVEGLEFVYYVMVDDKTVGLASSIRDYQVSETDRKIYVTSFKNFRTYHSKIYPPYIAPKSLEFISGRSYTSREYLEMLNALPLDSILDEGEGEQRCKAIGQSIFDVCKEKGTGTESGFEGLEYFYTAVRNTAMDGHLRCQYMSRAWQGVGDNQRHWHP